MIAGDVMRARGRAGRWGEWTPVLLLPAAAFLVHQLRFWLAYGAGTGGELARTGHSYLHSVVPWFVLAVALVAGAFLRAAGRAMSGHTTAIRFTCSLLVLWALCAAALLGIYAVQELLEGALATGHAAGLAGVFADGGWWAIPVAAAVGLVLAAALHGARWVLAEVARRCRRDRRVPHTLVAARRTADVLIPGRPPLAGGCSGRGPPA